MKKAIKVHPLVQKYLQNEVQIYRVLSELKHDPDPIIKALHDIFDAFKKRGNLETTKKVIKKYHDLDLSKTEVNLAIIFIITFTKLLRSQGYSEKGKALLNFAKSLLSNSINDELKLLLEHEISTTFKSKNDDFDFKLKTLPKLISKSFKAKRLMGSQLVMMGRSGLINKVKPEIINKLEKTKIIVSNFYDAVERYELIAAEKYLDSINKLIPKYGTIEFLKHERWVYLLQIFNESYDINQELKGQDAEHTSLINTNYFLSLNDIEMATKWSKYTPIKTDFESSNFLSYTYIRIALVNKNLNAAQSLLKQKSKIYSHYFDDFFNMRIHLLDGNKEQALIYFARLTKNCQKYKSEKMLTYELNLSHEIKAGDLWYLSQNLKKTSSKVIDSIDNHDQNKHQEEQNANEIIGNSTIIKTIHSKIKQFAKTKNHVLIIGETGVGKDLVARSLHENSPQKAEPFLAINCGAISESILQSELFGHEAGAYTSANKRHNGIFESAGRGTVFLDEIGDTSQLIQVSLLRVLENNEGRAVGSSKARKYYCRIIAATNANLKNKMESGEFREDLYFRLKSLEIEIPPLRERPDDIKLLIQHFFNINQINNLQPKISAQLMNAFKKYRWPGNIRELKNEVQKIRTLNGEKEFYDIDDTELFNQFKTNNKVSKSISINSDQKNFPHNQSTENEIILKVNKKSKPYRMKKIKELFEKYKRLSRQEITDTLNSSYKTIGTDLKDLIKEKFIEKIEPSSSPRTHYFVLKE